jgi:uncharacterized membrane protein YeaQ/YmgE (transglycosylase-associated protein family)
MPGTSPAIRFCVAWPPPRGAVPTKAEREARRWGRGLRPTRRCRLKAGLATLPIKGRDEKPERISALGLVLDCDLSFSQGGETMLTALIIAIVIGAIAGWLAGLLVQGTGFGLVGDIVVGILGALIAGFLFPMLGIALTLGGGVLGAIILAFIGAVILLVIVKLFKQIAA